MVNIQQDIKRARDETEEYDLQQQQQRKRRSSNHKSSIITSSIIHDFTLKAYTHQHGIVDVQLSKILTDFKCAVLFCYGHDL
ncbi:hypothetical protein INT45_000756 [Circinella minor]|uniref:Uncharacterized protein n=1 Tax=Circinella minor TaxID=1195481 RepID=A0A8H7RXY9_9FUNG|nr:hypothetical protein INT45_000756 [Circinella minor]